MSNAMTLPGRFSVAAELARELRYSKHEKRVVHAYSLATLGATYASLIATSWFPWLAPITFVIVASGAVRYAGYIHALNHAYRLSESVPWILEVLPVPSTPFIPGFSETRKIHLMHHKLETAEGDPDNYFVSGSNRTWAFLKCAFVFEYWFVYVLRHGWTHERFWGGWLFRLGIFIAIYAACGWKVLLLFMVASKVGLGIAFFLVSYLAHRHEGEHGNYLVPPLLRVYRLSCLLVGPYATDAAGLHAVHHARPALSCGKLMRAYEAWHEASTVGTGAPGLVAAEA